ncbi:amidohydrolase family protein [Gaetbulibacter sp. M240]|uniref:amidohydrolase family protein n=1 Tax=Gaetbulibacter sp. M240 TaxID=3126511 RepID=UPI00374ED789
MKKLPLLCIIVSTLFNCDNNAQNFTLENLQDTGNLIISNVFVVSMAKDTILKNQNILVEDGRIKLMTTSKIQDTKDFKVVDGTGKYVMPTLADAHVHLPESEDEFRRMMQLYLINGVTKLRSMRGDFKQLGLRKKYNTSTSIYPKLYLATPPISRRQDWSPALLKDSIEYWKKSGFDFIKILSVKNQDVFENIDLYSKKFDLPLTGHFPSNVNDSIFFQSNYSSLEHLGGLLISIDTLKERLLAIKKHNMALCPTLSWYSIGSGRYSYEELRQLPGMDYVPESTINDWIIGTKKYREKLGQEAYKAEVDSELNILKTKYLIIKVAHDMGISFLLSPDSSSKYMVPGFSVLGEMKLLKNANLSNFDILKMATTNFAAYFQEDYGEIEVGQKADFILLNENPLQNLDALKSIEGLYFNNHFLDSQQLQDMRLALRPKSRI